MSFFRRGRLHQAPRLDHSDRIHNTPPATTRMIPIPRYRNCAPLSPPWFQNLATRGGIDCDRLEICRPNLRWRRTLKTPIATRTPPGPLPKLDGILLASQPTPVATGAKRMASQRQDSVSDVTCMDIYHHRSSRRVQADDRDDADRVPSTAIRRGSTHHRCNTIGAPRRQRCRLLELARRT